MYLFFRGNIEQFLPLYSTVCKMEADPFFLRNRTRKMASVLSRVKCSELEQQHQSLSELNEILEICTWHHFTLLLPDAAVSSSGKQNINIFI